MQPDQEVEVKILSLDPERERIQLGLKQMQPKPWDLAPRNTPRARWSPAKVVRITTFGAFVELGARHRRPGAHQPVRHHRINKVEDAVNVGDGECEGAQHRPGAQAHQPEHPRVAGAGAYGASAANMDDGEDAVPVDIEAVGKQLADEAGDQSKPRNDRIQCAAF